MSERKSSIVILTGAGISAESGIATFRDKDGVWSNFKLEDYATPEAFERDSVKVQSFYNERRAGMKDKQPNAAHEALARLEKEHEGEVLLVTQNIDDLHDRAGSTNLIHMHGELLKAWCTDCGKRSPWLAEIEAHSVCVSCRQKGGLRPDVVWFGETPYQMDRIFDALNRADIFISIGTSGAVYPAAGFVDAANQAGATTIELNLEPSDGSYLFDETVHGPATKIVTCWVDNFLLVKTDSLNR
jgi:NAD-dependent deacetylase